MDPGMVLHQNGMRLMRRVPPEDGTAPYQVVGGVMAHQAYYGYGP
jgi:hypothetical protein